MCFSVLIAQESHPKIMIKHGMHMAQYSIHNLCCIILRNSKELQDNTG